MSTITYTNEDLLLGSEPHNHPLFVVGYVHEQKLNRILIDGGFAVTILPLRILKELRIPIDELSNSRLMIQGFNQEEQMAVGIIRMRLIMKDMVSSALFHVIDSKASYNMLLGRPYLHENAVVPSTWHQHFKYCRNGIVKMVLGDNKSFTEVESHFADAKYYIEDAKKGKEQPLKPPLKGFVPSTQEEEGRHGALAIDENRFDPKAFKLLIKAGYNPKEKLSLGKLPRKATDKKLHGLNATQIMVKEKGHAIQDSRVVDLAYNRKALHGIANRQSVFDRVLKGKAQTVIFTQVQSDDEDDKKSVASPNYIAHTYHITLIEDGEVEEEDAEDAPIELEEGIKATIDELKEDNLCDIEDPRPIYIRASLTQE
ncbi:hypothetical protein Sango_0261300 [Sesamum angolense]|uniref:G-patch domain-containing protein n=1 Tax=Sesamum angolense TaxID=2727404 RepID=A0AAE1XIA7_9LAMI|nr:hypothetical protein Sango_0261300 [Sesamum angolense]